MTFLKIAFFNMLKHIKRTLLVLFAVGISVVVMEIVAGMLVGMTANFFDSMLGSQGHFQIHGAGWGKRLDSFSLRYQVKSPDKLVEILLSDERVKSAEKIMNFGALLINDDRNITMNGYGLQVDSDFFSMAADNLVEGDFLPDGRGIAVSQKVAGLLNVQMGDQVNVLVEDSTGAPFYLAFPVTGIFNSGDKDFDNGLFFIHHDAAEELLYLENSSTEIRVRFFDREDSTPFQNEFQDIISADSTSVDFSDVETETWQQVNGSLLVIFDFFDLFMVIINLFIVVVAATVIMNTLLMNVFERLGEFGTMRAIGLKKRNLFGLIVLEGSVQGFFGSLLGLIVAVPVVLYFARHGLNWGEVSEAFGFGSSIQFVYTPVSSLKSLLFGVSIAVVSSLYAGGVIIKKSLVDIIS